MFTYRLDRGLSSMSCVKGNFLAGCIGFPLAGLFFPFLSLAFLSNTLLLVHSTLCTGAHWCIAHTRCSFPWTVRQIRLSSFPFIWDLLKLSMQSNSVSPLSFIEFSSSIFIFISPLSLHFHRYNLRIVGLTNYANVALNIGLLHISDE